MEMKKYLAIAGVFLLAACHQPETKTEELKDTTNTVADTQKAEVLTFEDEKTANIYEAYISLKDALVATKYDDATVAAKLLLASLKDFPGCESSASITAKIIAAKDIAGQRKEFTDLSTDLIALFKNASLKTGIIYVQHCPMANKGNGGDWLASEKKIQNPYYGDEMMECGAVTEEIKAAKN